ncbi:uncharacterized protein BO97DRAFT_419990 [Aspergillus homomorphus CBS 101889]|uniref:BZIP domain-containing protein n=1 Tax=Aspergillus homomorphus (strain CBS 101889) TaxID=1450537 RepID=A0A395IC31_ASPHC|nr:hypothetical protein BO97DRAFT_419990 [Aspergillus homomorphus CBS 101889]RAL17762.1 hypothetical protein BO97DRAFT_419990 [Aspergillus homomorphus CBS 101889]
MNNNNSHSSEVNSAVATDLPHRPAPTARSGIPGSERRRSAAGSNSILNNSNGSASESVSGESPLAPHDYRSSFSPNALRTSSSSSLGGSPIIAMGDPHHQRAPSLGELHQELEQEQEAQVNRLLHMIRSQQSQLHQLQQQHQQSHASSGTAVVDDASTPSERMVPFPPVPQHPAPGSRTSTQLASSLSSRRPSRPSSQAGSPSLRPRADSSRGPEGLEWTGGIGESPARRGSRDEGALYQAEAAMLARENQMLRQRIRELERQVSEFTLGAQPSESSATPSSHGTDNAGGQEPAGRGSASDLSDKT